MDLPSREGESVRPNQQPQAVGYARVSTEEQVREGVSLEAQRARIESWAQANDTILIGSYEDAGVSGSKSENREGLQQAIGLACDRRAIIVVCSLSRFSRSTKDTLALTERLEKAGADLVSLSERIDTTSAAGKMVFRMLAVLNEFERDQISERTAAALHHKREQRQAYSPTPDQRENSCSPTSQAGAAPGILAHTLWLRPHLRPPGHEP
jgi:site-specific DNA recombinase